jgi:hypothetical protein
MRKPRAARGAISEDDVRAVGAHDLDNPCTRIVLSGFLCYELLRFHRVRVAPDVMLSAIETYMLAVERSGAFDYDRHDSLGSRQRLALVFTACRELLNIPEGTIVKDD